MKDLKVKADELFVAKECILKGLQGACLGYLEAGKNLMRVRMKKLWRLDGTHITRFDDWVQSELGISKSTAYNAMEVYEKFGDLIINNMDYQRLDWTHYLVMLPYVSDKTPLEEKEKIIDLAKGQTVRGFRNNMRELRGQVPSDAECEHEETKLISICVRCNKWLR